MPRRQRPGGRSGAVQEATVRIVAVTARGPAIWWCTAGAAVLALAALAGMLVLEPGGFAVLQTSPYRLADPVGDLGAAAPLASIVANALTVVVPVPGTAVAMLNGALFGPWSGACLNWLGGSLLLANAGSLGSRAASPAFVLAQAFAAQAFAWLPMSGTGREGLGNTHRSPACFAASRSKAVAARRLSVGACN